MKQHKTPAKPLFTLPTIQLFSIELIKIPTHPSIELAKRQPRYSSPLVSSPDSAHTPTPTPTKKSSQDIGALLPLCVVFSPPDFASKYRKAKVTTSAGSEIQEWLPRGRGHETVTQQIVVSSSTFCLPYQLLYNSTVLHQGRQIKPQIPTITILWVNIFGFTKMTQRFFYNPGGEPRVGTACCLFSCSTPYLSLHVFGRCSATALAVTFGTMQSADLSDSGRDSQRYSILQRTGTTTMIWSAGHHTQTRK